MEKDILVEYLTKSDAWRFKPRELEVNKIQLYSNMKGFTEGRYRLEIDKLKRKVNGFRYKIRAYWTPYNPNYMKKDSRVNNITELISFLESVNKDLTDKERVFNPTE